MNMKRYILNFLVFLVYVLSSLTGFAQSPTSPALGFNIFVENDLVFITNECEGTVACGGDLTISGGYQAAIKTAGDFMVDGVKIGLLVGGKVNYNSGTLQINQGAYVKIGDITGSVVWYYDQNNAASNIRITPGPYEANSKILLQTNANQLGVGVNNNPVFESDLIDFALAFDTMRASSTDISQCPSNAELTDSNGVVIPYTNLPDKIIINLQKGANVLNLKGSDMNNVQILTYSQGPGPDKYLIINVDAPGEFTWNVWNQASISLEQTQYVIYNFYNTTKLNIAGDPTIEGTIFAPFADIYKISNQSNIQGQVIGKSFHHQGGQVHYSVFQPTLKSCAPPVVTLPVSGFEVNDSTQCLNTNNFVFSNTSVNATGYLWDFGDGTTSTNFNPSKTYTAPGVYEVSLTSTNTNGDDVYTTQITVYETTDAQVTQSILASGSGSVTKQLVLTNSSDYTSFSWGLSGIGTGLYPNSSIVNFEFTEAGYYEITVTTTDSNGCENTTVIPVIIVSEEVGTGNEGGLESESLGDLVSKRYLQRKMSDTPTSLLKTDALLFNKNAMVNKSAKTNGLSLLQMFPAQLTSNSTSHITSPTDILDYTIAEEVLSVDYSIENSTKAVVLGVRTSNKIYNHTKASCDRLRGAEILKVQTISLEGYNFLMQAIKQRSGNIEYAISFAIGKNTNDNFYSLQTNWFVKEYSVSNDVYNFQVWATSPEHTLKLVKDILNNLKSYLPVVQTEIQKLPKTYVSKVYRDGLNLVLNLKSIAKSQSIEITMDEVYSETNGFALRYNPVMSELEQQVVVEIKDGYEYDGLIKVNGEIQDAFYHADGNWGLDFDPKYTTISQYTVYNDFDRIYEDDEKPVHRNVKLIAHSEYDYLTLYKSLLPGNLPDDYTEYKYLSFTAKGSGLLDIGLVKSSVEQWKHQYKATVNVKNTENTYYIPFSWFKSTGTNQKMVADDLSMITFTFLPVEARTNDLDLTIENVKFTKKAPQGYEELLNTMRDEYIIYPNPSNGDLNCILYSDSVTSATVTLRDITGKLVYSKEIQLVEGRNDLRFDFYDFASGLMFINISNSKTDYGTSKVVIK